jgi:hypothetical protein
MNTDIVLSCFSVLENGTENLLHFTQAGDLSDTGMISSAEHLYNIYIDSV